MDKISYIRRRNCDNKESKNKKQLRSVAVVVITGCVLFGPTVLLCLALGQVWPLVMMVGTDALGATLGVAKFNRPPLAMVSCVPARASYSASLSDTVIQEKKAA